MGTKKALFCFFPEYRIITAAIFLFRSYIESANLRNLLYLTPILTKVHQLFCPFSGDRNEKGASVQPR